MQSPQDAVLWLQLLYLWSIIHFGAFRARFRLWRASRREGAIRRERLASFALWAPGSATPAGRLIWDLDQSECQESTLRVIDRGRDMQANQHWELR